MKDDGIPYEVIDDNKTRALVVAKDDSRELVRVGRLPQISKVAGRYAVPRPGLIFLDQWVRLQDFQAPMPPLPPNFPVYIIAQGMRETTKWNEVPYAAEIERKMRINPDASVRWEIDLLDGSKVYWWTEDAIMGEQTFVRWTWSDTYVTAPVLRAFCWVANLFAGGSRKSRACTGTSSAPPPWQARWAGGRPSSRPEHEGGPASDAGVEQPEDAEAPVAAVEGLA